MELHIKCQKEFDEIQDDFQGTIYLENGTNLIYVTKDKSARIIARGNSSVVARDNSSVVARDNSSVVARDNSSVVARGNSSVKAWDNSSVKAWDNSSVKAWDNSSVVARDNSSVKAWDNSSVIAMENSSVVARDNSSVEARDNVSVGAMENSSVVARDNSSVEAWDNSSVKARGNSSVKARGNSSVKLNGFSQARIMSSSVTYKTFDKSRVILPFTNFDDFVEYFGIKVTDGIATMYKAVHKRNGLFIADYDGTQYEVGKQSILDRIDTDVNISCGRGLHLSTMNFALNFGSAWDNLAILECESKIEDIVIPLETDGKVRTKSLKVIREVPLEECGLYGKILARRRNNG